MMNPTRATSSLLRRRTAASARRGFTLVEIVIVAVLITILSAIAVFSVNDFYNTNARKATIADIRQTSVAMSFARDDLGFYPKLPYLANSLQLTLLDQSVDPPTHNAGGTLSLSSSIDYWGFYPGGTTSPFITRIQTSWGGPYMGMSSARDRSSRGSASGIVKVRLPDVFHDPAASGNPEEYSLLEWPADNWGNPYAFYQLKTGINSLTNALWGEIVETPAENGDYLTAIVSYGPNQVPGGNGKSSQAFRNTARSDWSMFVPGDPLGTPPVAAYTLKVAASATTDANGVPEQYLIRNPNPAPTGNILFINQSLRVVGPDPDNGIVGVLDDRTDDIVFKF